MTQFFSHQRKKEKKPSKDINGVLKKENHFCPSFDFCRSEAFQGALFSKDQRSCQKSNCLVPFPVVRSDNAIIFFYTFLLTRCDTKDKAARNIGTQQTVTRQKLKIMSVACMVLKLIIPDVLLLEQAQSVCSDETVSL